MPDVVGGLQQFCLRNRPGLRQHQGEFLLRARQARLGIPDVAGRGPRRCGGPDQPGADQRNLQAVGGGERLGRVDHGGTLGGATEQAKRDRAITQRLDQANQGRLRGRIDHQAFARQAGAGQTRAEASFGQVGAGLANTRLANTRLADTRLADTRLAGTGSGGAGSGDERHRGRFVRDGAGGRHAHRLRPGKASCLQALGRHQRGVSRGRARQQGQRFLGMPLVQRMQSSIMQQPRGRRLVGGARGRCVGLLEQRVGLGEAALVGYLQCQMHQRIDRVRIIPPQRLLLHRQRGAIGGLGGGKILRQVGARAERHQALVVTDIAGAEGVRGERTCQQCIDRRRRQRSRSGPGST